MNKTVIDSYINLKGEECLSTITYEGGVGESFEDAIIIKGQKNNLNAVSWEHEYLHDKYTKNNIKWQVAKQCLRHQGEKAYDVLEVVFPVGERRCFYFDITENFGK